MTQIAEGSLLSHLAELRRALIWAVAGVFCCFLALLPFSRELYTWASAPLQQALPSGAQMIAIQVASPLIAPVKLTAFAALFAAAPWIFFHLWRFVGPALYRREKRFGIWLFTTALALFYAGAVFAYFAVFPLLFRFFQLVVPEGVQVMTDISYYLSFILQFMLVFGLAFETPIIVVLLTTMGTTTPDKLAATRPWIILGTLCVGMLLTPPDVVSQLLLALPVWLLFEIGILASRLLHRNKE